MIFGAHLILESTDADADRAFFRDVLGFPHVDAGRGWLIFRLPPAELATHPAATNTGRDLYFLCDDLDAELARLRALAVEHGEVSEQRWGRAAMLTLPSGGRIGLYQPKHPLAIER